MIAKARTYRQEEDRLDWPENQQPRRGGFVFWTILFSVLAIAAFVGGWLAPKLITSVILWGLGTIALCCVMMVLAVAMEPNEGSE